MSPVAALDPHSGDVTYTEQLLAHPPPGVVYTTYDRALSDGTLQELGTRANLATASGLRNRAQALGFAAIRRAERSARSRAGFYREGVRVLAADPREFDLVHVHVFNTRFVRASPPVIMSAAGPLEWVYRDAWGWSEARARRADRFDAVLARPLDATLHARRLGRARRFIAFSHYLKGWMVDRGFDPEHVDVVPNYISASSPTTPPRTTAASGPRATPPRRIGFVAKDFEAKGGDLAVRALEILRRQRPDVELVVIGSAPRLSPHELARAGITWLPFVPRTELLTKVLPTLDVLLHPSRFDGLPYGPMEALAEGIPLVVSDYRALPEMVRDGAGRVARANDPVDVARATSELLEPATWARASDCARRLYASAYSAESQAPALRRSYELALRLT